MGWLRPQHVEIRQERLNAILAESARVSSEAAATAEEIKASAKAEEAALKASLEDTRRRRDEREKRARDRIRRDPGVAAVNEVLKLLEGRH